MALCDQVGVLSCNDIHIVPAPLLAMEYICTAKCVFFTSPSLSPSLPPPPSLRRMWNYQLSYEDGMHFVGKLSWSGLRFSLN